MSPAPPAQIDSPPASSCDRADALAVLRRLRDAGHEAYFAGGCVRDMLLGREPKDYDVATAARPDVVRRLFPRTQAVGAAFGVILVRHGRSQVEVATFRADGQYADGRRPQDVRFTSAEEDARRRDFTINGLFLDPLDGDRVIDFVGGRDDLRAGLIRAIGDPDGRFEEDHLRLMRAVRFAARLGFAIEPVTASAVRSRAPMLARISPERVAEELRTMLPPPTRTAAWRLLNDFGLAEVIFRFAGDAGKPSSLQPVKGTALSGRSGGHDGVEVNTPSLIADAGLVSHLAPGEPVPFFLAMATAIAEWAGRASASVNPFDPKSAARLTRAVRQSLRLSNEECEGIEQTLAGVGLLTAAAPPSLAAKKRFLARPTSPTSRLLAAAAVEAGVVDRGPADALLAELAELEKTAYAPPPLITGDDLAAVGMQPGPAFKRMLDAAYDAQLEGRATTPTEAMAVAREVAAVTARVR